MAQSLLIADCPRCGSERMTFDILAANHLGSVGAWRQQFEIFCRCRHSECELGTIFVVLKDRTDAPDNPMQIPGSINGYYVVDGFVTIKDAATTAPPDHIPADVAKAFNEAATSVAVECWNAAGAMFRACVDLTTRPMLPPLPENEGETVVPPRRVRRDLGLRLGWLFDNQRLPENLRELSKCIREDGNDAAHQVTLDKPDAMDLQDFVVVLLERIFTEPERLRLAQERREKRREPG